MDDLDSYVRRLCEYSATYRNRAINYVELKNMIQRFRRLNPEADIRAIDWVAHWDGRLTYSENLRSLANAYPMYRWFDGEDTEQAFENAKRERVERILRELNEEDVKLLLEMARREAGAEESETSPPVQEKTSEPERSVGPQRRYTLSTLTMRPWLPKFKKLASQFTLDDIEPFADDVKGRLIEAVERGERGIVPRSEPLLEALTFLGAKAVAIAIGDGWLLRRWALAEAARIERHLHSLTDEELLRTANEELNIGCERSEDGYRVRVPRYLELASRIDGPEWRLVNRRVEKGWVYLSRPELLRMIAEAVEKWLLSKEKNITLRELPPRLQEAATDIVRELTKRRARYLDIDSEVSGEESWPPCMRAIKQALLQGGKVGHFANFALAAFMLTAGYTSEQVMAMYSQRSDFDERIARYQTEHIAGQRGSRVKYTPPSCNTMKTHGLCVEDGRMCPRNIENPLQYSLRRVKAMR